MNIVNERVEHITFGSGVITEINEDKILVKFQDNIGTKKFIFPDVFEKFLKALDPALESNLLEECRRKQEQIELMRHLEEEREAAEIEEKKAKLSLLKKKSATKSMKKKSQN